MPEQPLEAVTLFFKKNQAPKHYKENINLGFIHLFEMKCLGPCYEDISQ